MLSRSVFAILAIAILLTACTAVSLLGSLYFTFPGEPGFDPAAARRAEIFGQIFAVLAFPILNILYRLPPDFPLTSGPIGWLWFALNSLLWATVLYAAYRWLQKRRTAGA